LCEDAFVLAEHEGDPLVGRSRLVHERIADLLGRCDIELSALVTERFPAGPSWDADFLDWLAAEYENFLRQRGKELKRLQVVKVP
jgi:hypothetical protein